MATTLSFCLSSSALTWMQDLKKAMPDLGHGLQQLLDYPGDVEVDLATTFSVEEDNFGELKTRELKPGGSNIAVTNSNRQEYVDLYTKWVLQDSIPTQFAAFSEGFHQVILSCSAVNGPMHSQEMMRIICKVWAICSVAKSGAFHDMKPQAGLHAHGFL